jgi:hypothetical protein
LAAIPAPKPKGQWALQGIGVKRTVSSLSHARCRRRLTCRYCGRAFANFGLALLHREVCNAQMPAEAR